MIQDQLYLIQVRKFTRFFIKMILVPLSMKSYMKVGFRIFYASTRRHVQSSEEQLELSSQLFSFTMNGMNPYMILTK